MGMPVVAVPAWEDDELQMSREAAAEAAHREEFWQISPMSLLSLIAEVQAWRRAHPDQAFSPASGAIFGEWSPISHLGALTDRPAPTSGKIIPGKSRRLKRK